VAKHYSPKEKIFALPMTLGYYVMYYNNNIFDKFGVSYPKDGMTWDDVAALAKKVSHLESGLVNI
jgi:multiple sugar transport system substrate-binding protein